MTTLFYRVMGLVLLAVGFQASAAGLPSYEEVKSRYQASDILVLDSTGHLLQRVRTDFQTRRGEWIALGDISIALQRAVIRSEDQRFYAHEGIDWRAIASAGWGNLVHQQHRGASTLSMQLAGLLDDALRRGPSGRSLAQKFDQARQALSLEERWSKPQILEAYLNLAAFHGELVGVDALSRVLFQKHPSGLNVREAALAAVLLRGPNAALPVVVQRACRLLVDMGAPQECKGLSDFVSLALMRSAGPWAGDRQWAPHYARLAIEQRPAGSVRSGQQVVH